MCRAAAATSPAVPELDPTPATLPNIVLIVPDDLGRNDVSFNGGGIATPNIDRVAKEGVRLSRFYTAPVCSPTRAGLMTGRYPIRYGLMRSVVAPWRHYGLDTAEVTLPTALANAGYAHRGIFGKWHLGHFERKWHPLRRGFTEFIGHNTAVDYFTHEREGERDWSHGYAPVREAGYVTDLLASYASRFIEAHARDAAPFFLYVPFSAPHSPLQAKPEDLPRYAHLEAIDAPRGWQLATGGRPLPSVAERAAGRRIHGAMVHALDVGVGRILDALDANGIADNTLVLFHSDNGGSVGIGDNAPLRGSKATVYEGGIRVAAAARWPAGGISGGREVASAIAYIDVLPTLMRVAGLAEHGGKPLDGRDVLDALAGREPGATRDIYAYVVVDLEEEQLSVAEGDWKLVVLGAPLTEAGTAAAARKQLFRLDADPTETQDVAAEHPEVVARLLDKAIAFRSLQPPNPIEAPFAAGAEGFTPPPDWQFPEF